jgi:hypothetical protein
MANHSSGTSNLTIPKSIKELAFAFSGPKLTNPTNGSDWPFSGHVPVIELITYNRKFGHFDWPRLGQVPDSGPTHTVQERERSLKNRWHSSHVTKVEILLRKRENVGK